jgi:excisionase family DNA binding protein
MPREFAKAMHCSLPVIYKSLEDGTVPSVKIGRRYFIPRRVAVEILENGHIPQPSTALGNASAT